MMASAPTCNAYTACAGGSEVVACEIGGHGHQWAGGVSTGAVGGALSNDLDASEELYEFFAAHPM